MKTTVEPSLTETQKTITPENLSSEPQISSSNQSRVILISVALVLLGILIGVLVSGFIPQNPDVSEKKTPAITPSATPVQIIEPEISTPSPTLSATDESVINKFAGKKTTGGITPDLIQKCNLNNVSVYSLTQTAIKDSPSIVVDANSKYLMTCGVETNSTSSAVKKTNQCDLISMCQQIWTISEESSYICPEGEWISCMPVVEESRKFECEKPYIDWAKANCPNFKGIAY